MSWFVRSKAKIEAQAKKEMPDGLWTKCPSCAEVIYKKRLEEGNFTCDKCNYHFRVGYEEYISIIFDENSFVETHANLTSGDPLEFTDTKPYPQRLEENYAKSDAKDAIITGYGDILGKKASFACMNFNFIGGSMGSVVGEKIYRAAKFAMENKVPLIIISASGGARMQEAPYSLMQMAKTSAVLAELGEAGVPFISVLTDPTTGGVTASFAMLGDFNIAEPGALIGFAGPRVIEQTIRKKLPAGFQRAEFLLQKGMVDRIVHRNELKAELAKIIDWYNN